MSQHPPSSGPIVDFAATCGWQVVRAVDMATKDRKAVSRLFSEAIVQLCRANTPFGDGRIEVDGIICISGEVEGQELVVKVHEIFYEQDAPLPSVAYGDGHLGPDQLFGDARGSLANDGVVDCKRRRLAFGFKPPAPTMASAPLPAPPSSALCEYLGQLGCDPLKTRSDGFGSSRIDYSISGSNVLSVKAHGSPSRTIGQERKDGQVERTPTPRFYHPVSPSDNVLPKAMAESDQLQRMSVLSGTIGHGLKRWSPNRSLESIPHCVLCGSWFDSPEVLGEHNESVHSVSTCLWCFKTFTSRSNLERHSRLHTGHRPHVCPVCGKTFSRKDHLSNHAMKHAYKCGMCSQRCGDRAALAEHYRLQHVGTVLEAVCTFCNKGFTNVASYEEHIKMHPSSTRVRLQLMNHQAVLKVSHHRLHLVCCQQGQDFSARSVVLMP